MGDASVPPLRRAPTVAGATVARVGPVDSDPQPPDRPVDLTSDDPLAALQRWVADGQVDEAARARSRRRWLEKVATEEATLGGVLLDLAERGRPAHPAALNGHDCLCYSNVATPDVWRFAGPGQQNVAVQVRSRITVNSGEAMLPALRLGVGIARLPDFIIGAALAAGEVEEILTEWRPAPFGLHLVTPPSRLRPARVEALLDYLTRHHGC